MSLVKNTIDIECLVQALQNVIDAKNEYNKAIDEYDGGYSVQGYADSIKKAYDEFGRRLAKFIDDRIEEKLKGE